MRTPHLNAPVTARTAANLRGRRLSFELERIKIIGRECPRIGAEFLEKMRQKLGPMLFRQEFEGEFIDAESSAFSFEMIELALVDDFERFIQ